MEIYREVPIVTFNFYEVTRRSPTYALWIARLRWTIRGLSAYDCPIFQCENSCAVRWNTAFGLAIVTVENDILRVVRACVANSIKKCWL